MRGSYSLDTLSDSQPLCIYFNRRAHLLTQFLVKEFRLMAMSYFDDRYAWARAELAQEEFELVKEVRTWLGVSFNKEGRVGTSLDILGVRYNFTEGRITITDDRRSSITA